MCRSVPNTLSWAGLAAVLFTALPTHAVSQPEIPALATLPDDAKETGEELRTLRAEVTRVITELRLSLFELRSEVDRQGGLSATAFSLAGAGLRRST